MVPTSEVKRGHEKMCTSLAPHVGEESAPRSASLHVVFNVDFSRGCEAIPGLLLAILSCSDRCALELASPVRMLTGAYDYGTCTASTWTSQSDANISFPLGFRLARLQSRLLKWVIRIGATATGLEA
jgi:hypothetical protein